MGNFTVGGSGKSPAVRTIATDLATLGYPVVIGCSGYGSPRSEAATVAPEGNLDAREWGDEPAMLRQWLPNLPIIVGRDRVLAAQLAEQHFPDSILLMDDGLQHLRLEPQIQIALWTPISNPYVLPAGPYREPPRWLEVDLVLSRPFRLARTLQAPQPKTEAASELGKTVQSLAGIAHPYLFFEPLEAAGFELVKVLSLPDHFQFTSGTLAESFEPSLPILVTEKDWTKLKEIPDIQKWQIWAVPENVTIEPQDEFRSWLRKTIETKLSKKV